MKLPKNDFSFLVVKETEENALENIKSIFNLSHYEPTGKKVRFIDILKNSENLYVAKLNGNLILSSPQMLVLNTDPQNPVREKMTDVFAKEFGGDETFFVNFTSESKALSYYSVFLKGYERAGRIWTGGGSSLGGEAFFEEEKELDKLNQKVIRQVADDYSYEEEIWKIDGEEKKATEAYPYYAAAVAKRFFGFTLNDEKEATALWNLELEEYAANDEKRRAGNNVAENMHLTILENKNNIPVSDILRAFRQSNLQPNGNKQKLSDLNLDPQYETKIFIASYQNLVLIHGGQSHLTFDENRNRTVLSLFPEGQLIKVLSKNSEGHQYHYYAVYKDGKLLREKYMDNKNSSGSEGDILPEEKAIYHEGEKVENEMGGIFAAAIAKRLLGVDISDHQEARELLYEVGFEGYVAEELKNLEISYAFQKEFEKYIGIVAEKQDAFEDILFMKGWNFDTYTGQFDISRNKEQGPDWAYKLKAEMMGTYSTEDSSWLSAFKNPSGFPKEMTAFSIDIANYGLDNGVEELFLGDIRNIHPQIAEYMAVVAMGMKNGDGYAIKSYGWKGIIVLIVTDDKIKDLWKDTATKVLSIYPQVIMKYKVDHKNVLKHYLEAKGFMVEEKQDKIRGFIKGASFTADFDEHGSFIKMESTLTPEAVIPLRRFNFDDFWKNKKYAYKKDSYGKKLTDEMIEDFQEKNNYKLPLSLITLYKHTNGGLIDDGRFKSDDTVYISALNGIGAKDPLKTGKKYGLDGLLLLDEYENHLGLDYSKCGKDGEPEVVHCKNIYNDKGAFDKSVIEFSVIAQDFETFLRNLN